MRRHRISAPRGASTGTSDSPIGAWGATSARPRVLIVAEYMPTYRHRFFEMLEGALDSESIELLVGVGAAASARPTATDIPTGMPFVRSVPARSVSIAGRRLTLRRLSRLVAQSDLVIVEQALRHLENYLLLAKQSRGPMVALWGHGFRHVKPATRFERYVERRMTRSARWFFAYTQGGADHVASCGFPRERITVVQNTIDVAALAELRDSISMDEQRRLREELRLPERGVCLFIGTLHAPKRIGFLLEACSVVASRVPDFALVMAGDGPERAFVESSLERHPWLRFVGPADDRQKARLGAVSDILVMPGAVGLVAVDSFALQAPVVTTCSPFHGPEVEYLEDGVNARISGDQVIAFAQSVEQTLLSRDMLAGMKLACVAARHCHSIETMVANFAGGVIAALGTAGYRAVGSVNVSAARNSGLTS